MRIVHVSDCYAPRTGGIESQVADLASRQRAAGHEVHVLTATLGAAGERGGVVDLEDGVHVHRLGARIPFDLPVNPAGPRLLRDAYAALEPDVVHVHAGLVSPFAFDGSRLALERGLPTAITWHCMLDGVIPALRSAVHRTHWSHPRAALSAVSAVAAERVRRVFDAPVEILPNGLDLEAWAPDEPVEDVPPADTDADAGPLRLVATMRLAPRKRAVPLIELVAAARDRLPRGALRLSLIGSGPAATRVRATVARTRLQQVVDLRGRLTRPAVRDAYRDADVFLAVAELEAFGIAALEARTAGLAVVARRGTGVAEFVEDGVDGLLVADDAEMTEAVVHLARDRRLLDGILAHNRAVRPAFGWTDVLARAEGEYARARSLA
ncbi:glycosyl transferase family 1 [Cellulomonas chitinilytica]|uniref:Glycosyl transferase family 1 n=1 Tax=Cellulomonas chitinilytica TaxID=398759 RepID=A0A919U0Q8_9CELL|nr:glycosyltransferase family 4 protein [Cellulomonas chitinilytica]GIG19389.1 glycosyl transferase family 1 [Cellulomonas chitinilytica]